MIIYHYLKEHSFYFHHLNINKKRIKKTGNKLLVSNKDGWIKIEVFQRILSTNLSQTLQYKKINYLLKGYDNTISKFMSQLNDNTENRTHTFNNRNMLYQYASVSELFMV